MAKQPYSEGGKSPGDDERCQGLRVPNFPTTNFHTILSSGQYLQQTVMNNFKTKERMGKVGNERDGPGGREGEEGDGSQTKLVQWPKYHVMPLLLVAEKNTHISTWEVHNLPGSVQSR